MSDTREPAEKTGTDRWTKGSLEAGADPRDIERDATDPATAQRLTDERHLSHARESDDPDEVMGTSSDTKEAGPHPSDD